VAITYQGDTEYYAKYIPHDNGFMEGSTHQYLSDLVGSERNHTAPLAWRYNVLDGELIFVESCGDSFEEYPRLSRELLPIARQLVEGVDFMHEKHIRHNDLNLSNVAIHKGTGRVSILDFGFALDCRKNADADIVDGRFVGTQGWTAPEVGSGKRYSALLADVWAVGKIIAKTCELCGDDVPDREFLIQLSTRLMADNPKDRPLLAEVFHEIDVHINEANGVCSALVVSSSPSCTSTP